MICKIHKRLIRKKKRMEQTVTAKITPEQNIEVPNRVLYPKAPEFLLVVHKLGLDQKQ